MHRKKNGFTLVEMLLVIIIISTLAAMVVPRFAGRSDEAKAAAAQADVGANLSGALDLYELDNGAYPTTDQGLAALLTEPTSGGGARRWRGPYIKKKNGLKDPWGREYAYRSPGAHNADYDLYSFGPDGVESTADDIVNWEKDDGGG